MYFFLHKKVPFYNFSRHSLKNRQGILTFYYREQQPQQHTT
jgi:hypothetical protein